MELKWVRGNKLSLAIALQAITQTENGQVTASYTPGNNAVISVWAVDGDRREGLDMVRSGSTVIATDYGTLKEGIYAIEVIIIEADGTMLRSEWPHQVQIMPDNTEVAQEWGDLIAEGTQELVAATFYFAKGDKGDPGTTNYNELTNKPTFKTINNESILGSGNIEIQGGGVEQEQADWDQSDTTAVDYIKNKPTLFSGNYNDLTNKPTIPSALSELSSDSTHRVVTDTEKTTWNNKSDFSGSYDDLTNKPTTIAGYGITDAKIENGVVTLGGNTITPLTSHQDISGKEDKTNKVTSISSSSTDTQYPSAKCVYDGLDTKQATLVSGTNIKTINSQSILGSGDITTSSVTFRQW